MGVYAVFFFFLFYFFLSDFETIELTEYLSSFFLKILLKFLPYNNIWE